EMSGRLGADHIAVVPMDADALRQAVERATLIVNTTSLGMSPHTDRMPAIPPEAMHPELFIYDLIYNPLETALLRTARSQGARGTHGAGMLARQGALALELWTGQPAPAELMEQVVLAALAERQ
ncbi:MAG TPA: shikimate dehydrogenase, partial [Armatimonadota bacterium]|nr:shikimate dehydrogenase [Armatimonadota bacterium]